MGVYKCPVCGGRGFVGNNFYSNYNELTAPFNETCRSCGGKGIVFDMIDLYNINDFDATTYVPDACKKCPNHPSNGGSRHCNCILGGMNIVY